MNREVHGVRIVYYIRFYRKTAPFMYCCSLYFLHLCGRVLGASRNEWMNVSFVIVIEIVYSHNQPRQRNKSWKMCVYAFWDLARSTAHFHGEKVLWTWTICAHVLFVHEAPGVAANWKDVQFRVEITRSRGEQSGTCSSNTMKLIDCREKVQRLKQSGPGLHWDLGQVLH